MTSVGAIEPIPDVSLTQVFGLLELLDARGGREDGYRLARELNIGLKDLLKIIKAAEILGFISTPNGDVVLQPLGRQFLESDINQRKALFREQLKKNPLFSYIIRLVKGQDDRALSKELVLEHLAMLVHDEDPEHLFSSIVNWGRFAELFGYNNDEERFYLDQE